MLPLSNRMRLAVLLVTVAVAGVARGGEDWPRFRDQNGCGVSTSRGLPADFGSAKNVRWKVASSHGSSSPIVAGGQLYFSSFDHDQRTLHCLDAATGNVRWTQSVKKIRVENATPPNGPATPTPATSGDSVFVFYPDAGVLCYSAAGQERWRNDLAPFHSMHGIASSLMTVDKLVIVVADQLAGSYIVALRSDTGKIAWKADRADGLTGGYSTPAVYRPKDGPPQLIVSGGGS